MSDKIIAINSVLDKFRECSGLLTELSEALQAEASEKGGMVVLEKTEADELRYQNKLLNERIKDLTAGDKSPGVKVICDMFAEHAGNILPENNIRGWIRIENDIINLNTEDDPDDSAAVKVMNGFNDYVAVLQLQIRRAPREGEFVEEWKEFLTVFEQANIDNLVKRALNALMEIAGREFMSRPPLTNVESSQTFQITINEKNHSWEKPILNYRDVIKLMNPDKTYEQIHDDINRGLVYTATYDRGRKEKFDRNVLREDGSLLPKGEGVTVTNRMYIMCIQTGNA